MGLTTWFKNIGDNVKAIISGEKKPFEANVNSKKKTTKSSSSKKKILTKNSNGTFTATSSGKTYNHVYDYIKAKNYAQTQAKEHPWESFYQKYQQYKNGEITYDDLSKYNAVDQRKKHIAEQKEYNEKYAEENKSDRGIVDRLFGVLGYSGIVGGLYNVLDDDDSTTFLSGLKDGLKYMNPFEDDVSGRHYGSDLVKLLEQPDSNPDEFNIEDVLKGIHKGVQTATKITAAPITLTNKYVVNPLVKTIGGEDAYEKKLADDEYIRNFVSGFGYDVALDPISYVGGAFTAPFKALKGSGYGADVVKAVKQGENLSSAKQVASKLRELKNGDEASIAKFKKYTGLTTADDFVDAGMATAINADKNAARQAAEKMSRDYNQTIMHMLFDGNVKQGITVGFGNLPFATKKAAALRKEIVKNDTLKKIGDSTISPYYNSLTKKIRMSKLGKSFSTKNKLASDVLGHEKPVETYGLVQMLSKMEKTLQDSKVFDEALDIQKLSEELTPDEIKKLFNAVESGEVKSMRDFYRVREGIINELYKRDEATGKFINKKTGEIVENPESIENVLRQAESSNVLSEVAEANRENRFLRSDLEHTVSKYADDRTNARDYYALTGKELSKNIDTNELVEDMIMIDKMKNIGSYKKLLSDSALSEHPEINRLKQRIISDASEESARRIALTTEKDKITKIIQDYDTGKVLKNYDALELQSMSMKELRSIGKQLEDLGIPETRYRRGMKKREYAIALERGLKEHFYPEVPEIRSQIGNIDKEMDYFREMINDNNPPHIKKMYQDEVDRIFTQQQDMFENIRKLPNGKTYHDSYLAPYRETLKQIEKKLSKQSPELYKDGKFTEEGYKQIFTRLSTQDKVDIAMKYGTPSAKGAKLENNLGKLIENQKKIDDFMNSDMYDYLETAEAIINESDNFGKEFLSETPNVLSSMRSTSVKIQKAVDIAEYLSLGKHVDEALSETEKSLAEIFVDGMERARKNELRVANTPGREAAFYSHRESYIPHIKAIARALVNEDKNGNFIPDFSNVKSPMFHKGRKVQGTITDINKAALEDGEAKVFLDQFHEIYISRQLQSNRFVFANNTMKYIKENFSAPYQSGMPMYEGFSPGVLFSDVNDAFQNAAYSEFKTELLRQRVKIRSDILSNPKKYLDETYSGNVDRIKKALDESDEALKKSADNYGDDVFRQSEAKQAHAEYKEATQQKLTAAEELFKKKVQEKTDALAKQWEEANRNTFLDEKWQEYKTSLSELSDDTGKFEKFFSPNIVIQQLNKKQADWLKDTFLTEVRQYDNKIMERTNVASRSQKAYLTNSMLKLYDSFLNIWKIGNTMFAPSFHVQNALSNAFQSYLGIGADAFNFKKLKKASDVLRLKDPKQTVILGGKKYSYKQLEHIAKKTGVINESFAAYDFGKGGNAYWENGMRSTAWQSFKNVNVKQNPLKTIYEGSTVIGTNLEGVQRMNVFMSALDQGYGVDEAKKMVDRFLFDYSDLTDFEQNVMKRIIPFYTFMRKNLPMELKQMLEQPSTFSTLDKALTEFEKMDEEGYLNETQRNPWRQNYTQIPFTGQGINLQLPYYQLDRLEPNPIEDNGILFDKIVGSTSPLIKLLPEAVNGEYIYTGMPTKSAEEYLMGQTTPTSMLAKAKHSLSGDVDEDGNSTGLTKKDVTGYLAFPVADVNDVTVNHYPWYDVNTGEYIGKKN